MIFKHSIKKYTLIETALIVLLLLSLFVLINPLAVNAQVDEYGATTDREGLAQQISDTDQLDESSIMAKTRALRKLVFSFLASTTGLSSLFWLVARGGWAL